MNSSVGGLEEVITLTGAEVTAPELVSPQRAPSADNPARSHLKWMLVGCDALAALMAWGAASIFADVAPSGAAALYWRIALVTVITIAVFAALVSAQLYRSRVCAVKAVERQRLLRVSGMAGLAAMASAEITAGNIGLDLRYAVLGSALLFALLVLFRGVYSWRLREVRRLGRLTRPIIIVGTGEEASSLCGLLNDHPEAGYCVLGMVGPRLSPRPLPVPWLGELNEVHEAVRSQKASGVVVAASDLALYQLNGVVRDMLAMGVHVHLSSGLRGIAHHRLRAQPLAHEPLFYLEAASLSPWQFRTKRVLDMTVASVTLLLTAPVLALSAVLIKLHDKGPVLFRQQRVGRDGRLFTLLKLRTMVPDAEQRIGDLAAFNERTAGPLFKLTRDPRVTPIGRILRATSIDELPQLLNVLRGEMSLVGPRPALPSEAEQFDERLRSRARVLPGVSGLWQVEARDHPSFSTYQRLDVFYVENWSIAIDLMILVATVRVVLSGALRACGTGARKGSLS